MAGCAWCGGTLEIIGNQVGRRDTCPGCGADLHSCRNCRHFDLTAAKQCKEPYAEVPDEKESANFCEFFQIGAGGISAAQSRDALFAAAESLFSKKK
jgi:hypothetical protein